MSKEMLPQKLDATAKTFKTQLLSPCITYLPMNMSIYVMYWCHNKSQQVSVKFP